MPGSCFSMYLESLTALSKFEPCLKGLLQSFIIDKFTIRKYPTFFCVAFDTICFTGSTFSHFGVRKLSANPAVYRHYGAVCLHVYRGV